jgi:hypothetical protein
MNRNLDSSKTRHLDLDAGEQWDKQEHNNKKERRASSLKPWANSLIMGVLEEMPDANGDVPEEERRQVVI